MAENPWQPLLQTFEKLSNSVQIHLSNFIGIKSTHRSSSTILTLKEKSTGPVTKEELGRATWTFLHSLAAQYPEKPTKQQKKDVKELMAILSRMYPCRECAYHFKEIIRENPAQAGSQEEFSQWICHVHNTVNRSLGKVKSVSRKVVISMELLLLWTFSHYYIHYYYHQLINNFIHLFEKISNLINVLS